MVHAGPMRFTVTIQRRSSARRPSGQETDAWEEFAVRRAGIAAQTGGERSAPQQQVARVQTLFELRYLAGVTPKMRLLFDGRVFDIKSAIDPDKRRAKLLITAEELVGQAQ